MSGGGLRGESRTDAVHLAEIYDPATNTFRPAATAAVGRLYHSVALLLPDGRVITAGSNPDRGDDELRLELYHPPYLFKGPRPFLTAFPNEWTYGSDVSLHTPQAGSIKWAHLVRPNAVTHSDDASQRLVDLPIEGRDFCHLRIRVTREPNLAPPGWYLLFVVDQLEVPSVGEWIHLDAPRLRRHPVRKDTQTTYRRRTKSHTGLGSRSPASSQRPGRSRASSDRPADRGMTSRHQRASAALGSDRHHRAAARTTTWGYGPATRSVRLMFCAAIRCG